MHSLFELKNRNLLHYAFKWVFTIFSFFSQRDFPKLDIYKCPFLQNPPDFFLGIFFGYDRTFSSFPIQ